MKILASVILFTLFLTLYSLDSVKSQEELNSMYGNSIIKKDSLLKKEHSDMEIKSLSELDFYSHYKYWKCDPYSYPSLSFSLGRMYDYGENGRVKVFNNFNNNNIEILSLRVRIIDIFTYDVIDYYICESGLGGDGPYDLIIEESIKIMPDNKTYEIFNNFINPITYKFPKSNENTLILKKDKFYTFRIIFENNSKISNLAFIYFVEFETANEIYYSENFIYSFNDKKPFSELYKKELPNLIFYNFDDKEDDNSEFYEFLGDEFGYENISNVYKYEMKNVNSAPYIRFDNNIEYKFDKNNIMNSKMMKYVTGIKMIIKW